MVSSLTSTEKTVGPVLLKTCDYSSDLKGKRRKLEALIACPSVRLLARPSVRPPARPRLLAKRQSQTAVLRCRRRLEHDRMRFFLGVGQN